MKTSHISFIILVVIFFLGFGLEPAHADDANGISIQNILVQPSMIKVGDTFSVTATLVNNSTVPILVGNMGSNDCEGPFFTVSFDNHVKVAEIQGATCSYVALQERLDHGKKYAGTSPGLSFTYTAAKPGTANVTVAFPYSVKNQTDPNQSEISHTVSKSFLFTILDNNTNIPPLHGGPPFTFDKLTPLQQFKSGVAANDVTCLVGFQLIFKADDGSPACATPDTAKKLIEREWASLVGSNKIVPISFKQCDTPFVLKSPDISPLFPNDTQITTSYIPVFFVPTNSTGNICVQYTNSNTPSPGYARIFDAQNLSKNADNVIISPSDVQIPTGVTNMTFTIKTGDAGFYGIGFFCGGLPLAVGYDSSSNLVKDNFPWWDEAFHCPAMVYSSDITGTRGIGVHYIPEVTYSKIDYNITGTSVSSVHLSPTIQNITFTLHVHTFNDSADFWFDVKDSNYIKFNGDPKLEQEGSDPCTWSFTNGNAVGDEKQWYKMVGKVTVTDRPVTIPPHTNTNYTFSILAKDLDAGYYGLNPVIYGRPIDSTVPLENMGGGSVGSYYPVIMGLGKYLDPSGICSR